MPTTKLLLVLALVGFALPACGCGGDGGGVATGVDEPSPPLTEQEEAVEKANMRKMQGK